MKPEALNIIKMISKPHNERMPFQGIELTKFIQKIPFFKRFFPSQAQKFVAFCLTAQLVTFEANANIFKKQESPSYIYIIIDGKISLKSVENGRQQKVQAFDVFGNVEVVFDLSQRHEIAIAETDASCIMFQGKNFKKVWTKQEELNKSFHYLKINKYFQNLSLYEKQSLSLLMVYGKFRDGDILFEENHLNDKIYFIIYGKLDVVKKLTIGKEQRQAVIDSIEEMDNFGEFQALSKQPSQVGLRATSSGTYYCLMIDELLCKDHIVLKNIQKRNLSYPTKEQLQFRYNVQAEVQKYQKQIKKNLKIAKK